MSTISRGNIKIALASLRNTKWRSLLTMLGIIIGIVSVVTIVGIGEGVKRQIAHQIDHFGKDMITIRPGHTADQDGRQVIANADILFGLNSVNGLTQQDLEAAEKSDHVKLAAPLGVVSGSVATKSKRVERSLVLATNHNLPGALNQPVPYGAFFDDKDADANVAVIGRSAAQAIFDDIVPLGQSFTFRGETFLVRGMFEEFGGPPLSATANFDSAIFIPHKTAARLTNNNSQFYAILAKPDKPENSKAAISSLNKNLLAVHGGQRDFTVLDREQSVKTSSEVLNLLTMFIAGVAAISLLVGGVGIMNIMLVSVTERMHEIGVRKAIGATNRQILSQFLLEATVLSVAGGVIGILISLLVNGLLYIYTDLKPVISWEAVVIATAVSIVIGVVFGTAPAIKAARKDPIQALRHE